jgi:hypothetical protein
MAACTPSLWIEAVAEDRVVDGLQLERTDIGGSAEDPWIIGSALIRSESEIVGARSVGGLPSRNACVCVGPPLLASGRSSGSPKNVSAGSVVLL